MKKYISVILGFVIMLTSCTKSVETNELWWVKDKEGNINISEVWEVTHGDKEIVIGIIDSGIDVSNDGIKDSVYVNPNEIPNNGIDDDCNGYIDDVSGWNFYDDSNVVYTAYSSDYHGTMIAGILSDEKYGVAQNVQYLPLKCFRGTEGSIDDIIESISYAYNLGVRIFNCSWDTKQYNDELFNTIQLYSDAIFVCSGGKNHENLEKKPIYPACYDLPNIICVGGIDAAGDIYEFSGYGEPIDIYAPGVDVYSLMPDDTYVYSEGTSLSVAFVTGSIALARSIDSSISFDDIMARSKKDANRQILDVYKLCYDN